MDTFIQFQQSIWSLSRMRRLSSLIVATGALSIPTLGGSGFGYDLAKQFNLSVTSLRAGLAPFIFTDYMSERYAEGFQVFLME